MAAGATATGHDPHPLSRAENATFLPLVCRDPHVDKERENHCKKLIGASGDDPGDDRFDFWSVSYGSFTRSGADEAYATYYSSNEGHVHNFGGGILFAHPNGRWKVVKWFPGEQMDRCVSLPGAGAVRMLCLNAFANMGEADEWVALTSFGRSGPYPVTVLRTEHTANEIPWRPNGCRVGIPRGHGMLLSIEEPKRSSSDGFFATTGVTYESAADFAKRCNGAHLHPTRGVVRYRVDRGEVIPVTPVPFEEPWIVKMR